MHKVVDRYLSGRDLLWRYGITSMTLYRWRKDPEVNFPEPDLMIRDRAYWYEDATIVPWERSTVVRRRA